jgi:hypothetical protein
MPQEAPVDLSVSSQAEANPQNPPAAKSTGKKKRPTALVIKNFPGGQKGDLPLEKGQTVIITKGPAEKKWWRGHIEGKKEAKGIFPRACIQVIEQEEPAVEAPSAAADAARTAQTARRSKLDDAEGGRAGGVDAMAAEEARAAAEARVRDTARIAAEDQAAKKAAADEAARIAAEQEAAAAAAQAKAQARLRAQAQEAKEKAEAEAAAKAAAEAAAFAAAELQAKAAAEAEAAAAAAATAAAAEKARRKPRPRPRRDSISSTGGSSVASSVASISSRRKKARVLHDFEGESDGDLSLQVGQIVLLTKSKPGKNWWRGYHSNDPTKTRGAFPASFVEVFDEETAHTNGRGASLPHQRGNASSTGPAAAAAAPGNSALRSALVSAGVSPSGVSTVTSIVASLDELESLDYAGLMTMGLRLADRSKITAMRESLNQPAAAAPRAPSPSAASPAPSPSKAAGLPGQQPEGGGGGGIEKIVAVIDGDGKLGISFDVVWDEDTQEESEDLMIAGITPGSLASAQAPQLTEGLVLVSIQGESVSGTLADDVLDLLRQSGRPLRLGFAAAGYSSPR